MKSRAKVDDLLTLPSLKQKYKATGWIKASINKELILNTLPIRICPVTGRERRGRGIGFVK